MISKKPEIFANFLHHSFIYLMCCEIDAAAEIACWLCSPGVEVSVAQCRRILKLEAPAGRRPSGLPLYPLRFRRPASFLQVAIKAGCPWMPGLFCSVRWRLRARTPPQEHTKWSEPASAGL